MQQCMSTARESDRRRTHEDYAPERWLAPMDFCHVHPRVDYFLWFRAQDRCLTIVANCEEA